MSDQTSFEIKDAVELKDSLQKFHETLDHEWSQVLSRWGNLKSVWQDEQFEKFEPLFEDFIKTYQSAEQECDKYIVFMREQIQIAEDRESRMGNLT